MTRCQAQVQRFGVHSCRQTKVKMEVWFTPEIELATVRGTTELAVGFLQRT
jgi:hypothetical protein